MGCRAACRGSTGGATGGRGRSKVLQSRGRGRSASDTYKSASLQVCKSASLQVCKSASLQVVVVVCKSASLCRLASSGSEASF